MLSTPFVCKSLYWTPLLVLNLHLRKQQQRQQPYKSHDTHSHSPSHSLRFNLNPVVNLIEQTLLMDSKKNHQSTSQFARVSSGSNERTNELVTPPPPIANVRQNATCNTPAPHQLSSNVKRTHSAHTFQRSSSDPNVPTANRPLIDSTSGYSDWMAELPERAKNAPIYSLCIPGSHDSGSYALEIAYGLSPDRPGFREKWWFKMFPKIALRITKEWSKTQEIDIATQLKHGIRYLDIRVAPLSLGYTGGSILRKKRSASTSSSSHSSHTPNEYPASDRKCATSTGGASAMGKLNDLRFVHALYGPRIVDILDQVKNFLDSHPKEIVILHFQHLVSLTPEVKSSLVAHIEKLFANKLVPSTHKDAKNLSISQLNSLGYQVILFFPCDTYVSDFIWPASHLPNPWANTTKPSVLFKFLDSHINARNPSKFYVTQGVLTPDDAFVTKNLLSSLKKSLAVKANRLIDRWLKGKTWGPKGPNIVMTDFIELDDYQVVRTVIAMNLRGFSRGEL